MVTLAQATEALGTGTGQQILAVVVGLLVAALTWVVRLHLKERALWESKFEKLHEQTLGVALKVQSTIIKLGETQED